MVKVALLVRLEAKPGKEDAVKKIPRGRTATRQSGERYSRVVRPSIGAVLIWNF